MKKILFLLISLFMLAAVSVPVDACHTSVEWIDGAGFAISGDTIHWGGNGNCDTCSGGDSALSFSPINYTEINIGDEFALGTLTFTNNRNSGTPDDHEYVDLNLSFFGTVLDGTALNIDFTFHLSIDETSNYSGNSDDSVYFAEVFSQPFNLGDNQYLFNLLGFGPEGDEGFSQMLTVEECQSGSAQLYARIDAVPVPASIILLGSGLLSIIGISRRKAGA